MLTAFNPYKLAKTLLKDVNEPKWLIVIFSSQFGLGLLAVGEIDKDVRDGRFIKYSSHFTCLTTVTPNALCVTLV
jgi:hypothetical protein